jgi:hypothetical protein
VIVKPNWDSGREKSIEQDVATYRNHRPNLSTYGCQICLPSAALKATQSHGLRLPNADATILELLGVV